LAGKRLAHQNASVTAGLICALGDIPERIDHRRDNQTEDNRHAGMRYHPTTDVVDNYGCGAGEYQYEGADKLSKILPCHNRILLDLYLS